MVMDVLHSVLVLLGSVVVSEGWCVSGRPLAWVLMSFWTDTLPRTMLMSSISHERGDGCGVDGVGIHPTRLTCLVGVSVLAWAMRTSVVKILLLGGVGGSQGAGRTGVRRDR